MNTKIKIKKLIGKSIILTKERKQEILTLLDSLHDTQTEELFDILKIEEDWINSMLEEKYNNDQTWLLLEKFKKFKKETYKNYRIEAEIDDKEKGIIALNGLEEQLSQV